MQKKKIVGTMTLSEEKIESLCYDLFFATDLHWLKSREWKNIKTFKLNKLVNTPIEGAKKEYFFVVVVEMTDVKLENRLNRNVNSEVIAKLLDLFICIQLYVAKKKTSLLVCNFAHSRIFY